MAGNQDDKLRKNFRTAGYYGLIFKQNADGIHVNLRSSGDTGIRWRFFPPFQNEIGRKLILVTTISCFLNRQFLRIRFAFFVTEDRQVLIYYSGIYSNNSPGSLLPGFY
jgi:hypothetical protein